MQLFKFLIFCFLFCNQINVVSMNSDVIAFEDESTKSYKTLKELCDYCINLIQQVANQPLKIGLTGTPESFLEINPADLKIFSYINDTACALSDIKNKNSWPYDDEINSCIILPKEDPIPIEVITDCYKRIFQEFETNWMKLDLNQAEKKLFKDHYKLLKIGSSIEIMKYLIWMFNIPDIRPVRYDFDQGVILFITKDFINNFFFIFDFNISYSPKDLEKTSEISKYLKKIIQDSSKEFGLIPDLVAIVMEYYLSQAEVFKMLDHETSFLEKTNHKRKL